MTLVTRLLREDVTFWANEGSNGVGGFTFAAPVILKGRWEDKTELIRDATGREVVSASRVFLKDDVEMEDYLARGDLTTTTDPTTLAAAFRVRRFDRITDLRNINTLRRAFL